jgi:hypothetical protein
VRASKRRRLAQLRLRAHLGQDADAVLGDVPVDELERVEHAPARARRRGAAGPPRKFLCSHEVTQVRAPRGSRARRRRRPGSSAAPCFCTRNRIGTTGRLGSPSGRPVPPPVETEPSTPVSPSATWARSSASVEKRSPGSMSSAARSLPLGEIAVPLDRRSDRTCTAARRRRERGGRGVRRAIDVRAAADGRVRVPAVGHRARSGASPPRTSPPRSARPPGACSSPARRRAREVRRIHGSGLVGSA